MKIILANDHMVVNLGLSALLGKYFSQMQIVVVCSYQETMEAIHTTKFDLIIIDINMEDCKSFQKIEVIKKLCPDAKIVIFTDNAPDSYEFHCLKAGANAFIRKNSDEKTIKYILEQVFIKGKYFSPRLIDANEYTEEAQDAPSVSQPYGSRQLSNREMDVCNLLVKGNGVLEIANTLGLSYSTIGTYKKRIFEKLKINNIAQLISLWNSRVSE